MWKLSFNRVCPLYIKLCGFDPKHHFVGKAQSSPLY
uniref:Uncharacterized protein n=1 Tax=Arundo donax TaxID=35708 RepID=A0A0A9ECP0_ARUDO